MIHQFTVYGEVRGQGRPKVDFTRRRVYKDKRDVVAERRIKNAFINSGGKHFGNKPLMMMVVSHRILPDSKPKRIQSEPDILKPDTSNILKSVEDALNGIAYYDDKQIVLAVAMKTNRTRFGNDYVEVCITDEIDTELMEAKAKGLLR